MVNIAGAIPQELCSSTGLSLNVDNTGIQCYSGCLTSAKIIIHGASATCPNGSILRDFLVIVGVLVGLSMCAALCYAFPGVLSSPKADL